MDIMKLQGFYTLEHWRGEKLLHSFSGHNGIKNVGKKYLLDTGFSSPVATPSLMYIGLLLNTFSSDDADDVIGDISTFEFTDYTISAGAVNRGLWNPAAAAEKVVGSTTYVYIINSTNIQYDITGAGTLSGLFVSSAQAKSAYTGTLWSTADFTVGDITVANLDTLRISYEIRTPAAT